MAELVELRARRFSPPIDGVETRLDAILEALEEQGRTLRQLTDLAFHVLDLVERGGGGAAAPLRPVPPHAKRRR